MKTFNVASTLAQAAGRRAQAEPGRGGIRAGGQILPQNESVAFRETA